MIEIIPRTRKHVAVVISNGFYARNVFRSGVASSLVSRGVTIYAFVDPSKISFYREEYPSPFYVFLEKPNLSDSLWEKFFYYLETASIPSNTVWLTIWADFARARGNRGLPGRVFDAGLRVSCWWLGRFRTWRYLIRKLYLLLGPRPYRTLFNQFPIDLVFSPATLGADNAFLREAILRNIPTVAMIFSWDNLFSKSIIRVAPNLLLTHNNFVRDQAKEIGDFPEKKILVVGVPHYDLYQDHATASRREFCSRFGMDPENPILVYAFSGKMGLENDFALIALLSEAKKRGDISSNINVLIRPYPRYDFSPKHLALIRDLGFFTAPVMHHSGSGAGDWDFNQESEQLLVETLFHADLLVNMYSTFMIEGARFGKPCVVVAFDAKPPTNPEESAERFFLMSHLAYVNSFKAFPLVRNYEELCVAITDFLTHKDAYREARQRLVKAQDMFLDGKSAGRISDAIISQLS